MPSWYGIRNRLNQFLKSYGYHHGKTKLYNAPLVFSIEPTNHCNLKCVMCPRGEPDVMEREVGHMPLELFKKIVDQCGFYSQPCWFHMFGEPLMSPYLFEEIDYAKEHGIQNVGISCNATLLNDLNAKKILNSKLDVIILSIDGTTADVYENVRKSSHFSFEEVKGNARHFLKTKKELGKKNPHVILSIISMKETENELSTFKEYWLNEGANEVWIKPYITWANQTHNFLPLATYEKQVELDFRQKEIRPNPCKLLWESCIITWDGKVCPCCYDYDAKMVMGDLTKQTLKEIWNSDKYKLLRKLELEGRNSNSLCAKCTHAPQEVRNPLWPLPNFKQVSTQIRG